MNIKLYNEDNLEVMKRLPNESIDVICIDPPYLYLKNQKLERPFDEQKFFSECARLLTKNGFIVMFGRGESFYRWNSLLENTRLYKGEYVYVDKQVSIFNDTEVEVRYFYKGIDVTVDKAFKKVFTFKEEIIWNKSHCTSPLMNLSRVHETISIFCKGKAGINKVKVPYLEMKSHDVGSVINDVKRMRSVFKNTQSFNAVLEFLEENKLTYNDATYKQRVADGGDHGTIDRCVSVVKSFNDGLNEKSIIRTDFATQKTMDNKSDLRTGRCNEGDRCVTVANAMISGMNEKSIINEVRNHYKAVHPTEKPVRLLERLLKLVIPMKNKKVVIADFFSGSASCGEAVFNLQSEFSEVEFEFIGTEIDEEYFTSGKERIENLQPNLFNKAI